MIPTFIFLCIFYLFGACVQNRIDEGDTDAFVAHITIVVILIVLLITLGIQVLA